MNKPELAKEYPSIVRNYLKLSLGTMQEYQAFSEGEEEGRKPWYTGYRALGCWKLFSIPVLEPTCYLQ